MSQKNVRLLSFGLVSTLIALVVTLGLYIPYLHVYNLVHPTRRILSRFPTDVGIDQYKDVQFITSDGLTITGWYIPPKNKAIVIFVHGQGDDRSELLDEAGFIVKQGYGALLVDLRAHGQSDGTVSTLGAHETRDIRAAVDFVHGQAGPNTPVALLGRSMGAGISIMAAAEIPEIRAVIIECAFTSLEDNVNDLTRVLTGLPGIFTPLLIFYGEQQTGVNVRTIRPVDAIGKIGPRPVLLVHGEKDVNFPVRNAHTMYTAAKEPKQLYIIPNAAHGGFLQAEPKHFPQTVLTFLETYLK